MEYTPEQIREEVDRALAGGEPDPAHERFLKCMTFAVCLGILGLTLLVVSCIGPSLAQNKKGNVVPDFWITDPNGRLTWLPYWPAWSKYVLLAAGVTMGVSACLGAISAWGLRCNEQRGRKGVASALSKMGVKLKSDG